MKERKRVKNKKNGEGIPQVSKDRGVEKKDRYEEKNDLGMKAKRRKKGR